MKTSLDTNRRLENTKLLGVKKATSQTNISNTKINVRVTQQNRRMERAALEAERKKAEAITILRHYTLIR